jgi:heat shock protein HtpX
MSTFKTGLLLAALTGLFLAIGYGLGGKSGMMIAFLMALATNAFAYWNSDSMILSAYDAREVGRDEAPEFHGLIAELARNAGLPMPRVYIINGDQPNAFATGRDPEHAAVAATTGLLDMMSREQIAGVMAHELAHVKHRDTLVMTITATIAGAIGMLANLAAFGAMFGGGNRNEEEGGGLGGIGGLVMMILAPLMATIVQMAISRTREFEADADGARICGQPLWLASALARLEQGAQAIPNPEAERHPGTAHLFIVNPLSGSGLASLFSTHPNMEERISRLQQMAGQSLAPAARSAADPATTRGPWG